MLEREEAPVVRIVVECELVIRTAWFLVGHGVECAELLGLLLNVHDDVGVGGVLTGPDNNAVGGELEIAIVVSGCPCCPGAYQVLRNDGDSLGLTAGMTEKQGEQAAGYDAPW